MCCKQDCLLSIITYIQLCHMYSKQIRMRGAVKIHLLTLYSVVERGGGVCLTTHTDIPIRRRGIQTVSSYSWSIVQDTGAPTTHDKTGSLTCPVLGTDTQEQFAWEEPVHISFCKFSWSEGDQIRNPWIGSQVFYH